MNAQTLSVIFASEIFKANPQMVLSAIALASGPEALAALAAPVPEAPAALPEAPKAPKEKRAPSAWNVLVDQTVRDMRENGWAAFTDVEGTLWPASRPEGDKHVYSDGKYAGKEASRAAGGFKLASLRNSESKPEAAAAALARLTQREEVKAARRAKSSASDEEAEAPKKARKPQSEETKKAAAAKRAATKAAKAASPELRPVDLALDPWKHNGTEYLKNERGDVLTEDGEWVGRWNGSSITEAPEPADFEYLTIRD